MLRAHSDVALLDLEDSVAAEGKDAARVARPGLPLRRLGPGRRGNDRTADQRAGTVHGLVLIPKVESARDIDLVAQGLDAAGRGPSLCALIETPRAMHRLDAVLATP